MDIAHWTIETSQVQHGRHKGLWIVVIIADTERFEHHMVYETGRAAKAAGRVLIQHIIVNMAQD